MSPFLIHILLVLCWAAVSGSFTLANLALGFVLGAFALHLIRLPAAGPGYLGRIGLAVSLFLLFVKELMLSAWRVAVIVTRPDMRLKPGIVAHRLDVKSDAEITLLANLITLTPGTLSMDVSQDRSLLFVHALDCSDPEAIRSDIAQGFEARVKEVFN